MGKETIYRCDYRACRATRPFNSPTNHWFVVSEPDFCQTVEGKGFLVIPFPTTDNFRPTDKLFCGEVHAMGYISQQMWEFYSHAVETPSVVESVAPATLGLETQAILHTLNEVSLEQVPFDDLKTHVVFSDLPTVERDQRDAFCMDVEDPGESHDRE